MLYQLSYLGPFKTCYGAFMRPVKQMGCLLEGHGLAAALLDLLRQGRAEQLNQNQPTLERELCKPGVPVV